jgi:hypothetical protein
MRANQYLSYMAVCEMGVSSGLSVRPVASLKSLSRDLNTLPNIPGSLSPLYACFRRSSSRRWRRDGSANPLSSSGSQGRWGRQGGGAMHSMFLLFVAFFDTQLYNIAKCFVYFGTNHDMSSLLTYFPTLNPLAHNKV